MSFLDRPLGALPGIGPKRSRALAERGLVSVEDLLLRLPVRHEDRSHFEPLSRAREGVRTTFLGTVTASRVLWTRRRGFSIFEATLDDGTARIPAVWYNQHFLAKTLVPGFRATFHGAPRRPAGGRGALRFENPQFEAWEQEDARPIHSGRIVPVYERIGPLSGKQIRALVHRALEALEANRSGDDTQDDAGEFLPAELRERYGFPDRVTALRGVHFPERLGPKGARDAPLEPHDTEGPEPGAPREAPLEPSSSQALKRDAAPDAPLGGRVAGVAGSGGGRESLLAQLAEGTTPSRRRLAFEELLLLQAGAAERRWAARGRERVLPYDTSPRARERAERIVPFQLTAAQRRAFEEIVTDLERPHPMARLLLGDVGCGKTIVAALAIALAARSGLQSAIMAATELLAQQLHRVLGALLGPSGVRVELLTSGQGVRARREFLGAVSVGEVALAVGTHALAEDGVEFRRLGLVVVDEQHRFGVAERARLLAKGASPDLLVMTATPIPRTLALCLYGDLDLSVIDELPPGRPEVVTRILRESDRPALYASIGEEIARGGQAFIVYPLAEEKAGSELRAARQMARRLSEEVFPGRKVGLVHGSMKPAEKLSALEAFRRGETAVLVATTVVEVGIDVPSASMLVVEHAERFGLAQLHQLRGRIGRGGRRSTCVLMAPDDPTDAARARLDALERERSGFVLAELDLELRGPGHFFGTRQSGVPDLRVAHLVRDRDLLEAARRELPALIEAEQGSEARAHGTGEGASRPRRLLDHLPPAWSERLGLASVG